MVRAEVGGGGGVTEIKVGDEYIIEQVSTCCVREKERIVRCKDCNHRRKSWNGKRPDFIPDGFFCWYWGGHELWNPDGYCAWGERRREA